MKEKTVRMYPVRRLIELCGGSVRKAAEGMGCSEGMVHDALRTGEIATVAVLAAECIIRRQGPSETERAILSVTLSKDKRGAFILSIQGLSVRVIHLCDTCLVLASPWRNVGAVQEIAKHLGGEASRTES